MTLTLPTNSKVYLNLLYTEVARLLHDIIKAGRINFVTMIVELENH